MQEKAKILVGVALTALLCTSTMRAQDNPGPAEPEQDEVVSVFPHAEHSRFWAAGQMNFIFQAHPEFRAKYSGPNSLRSEYEKATSRVLTLYMGVQLDRNTDLLVDFESAGGRGLSDALGLAGFTNLDVVRNPTLGSAPYLARLLLHRTFAIGDEEAASDRGPLPLATSKPARRIEVWLGKLSTVDFFDLSSVGSDSHLQFTNWTIDNNGAYDYAADTRGYTYGAVIGYYDSKLAIRFGETLMPQIANGVDLEFNLRRAHAENAELEIHRNLLGRPGTVRLLGYVNHANMGIYRQAIDHFLSGGTTAPDITNHPRWTQIKYGFGVNIEQELANDITGFLRVGWNDGRTESFAYTEADQTLATGVSIRGSRWSRPHDRAGAALVINGLSNDHREYLALGGIGFILGDGRLNYGRETIIEGYYRLHIWKGVYAGPDLQRVWNPGYNRDRGPVIVAGFRLHFEL